MGHLVHQSPVYRITRAGAKHLEREVSSFERMLEGITRVLAPGES